MSTLIIHGRQPALGRAELESLHGADVLRPVGKIATLIEKKTIEIDFMRLGGMMKFCKVLTVLDTTDWNKIHKFLESVVPAHAANLPDGKLNLGLSAYELQVTPKRLQATALSLKKSIRTSGRSVRVIPNDKAALNTAQVLHNKLTQKLGWELVFIRDGNKTIVAQSIAVQDIERYAARDQARPYRDSRIGMLPPKLAQTIINLATAEGTHGLNQPNGRSSASTKLLDPFCGTGVVLQEALLIGYTVTGSDIDKKMVEYTNKNLDWLKKFNYNGNIAAEASLADATSHSWKVPFDFIACETYLGRPFTSLPDSTTLEKVIQDTNTIHKKFLQNIARQTKPGFRMCIAVPAWKTKSGFRHLSTLDHLKELGYNRLSFVHVSNVDLIYHRPGQIVARELTVIERI